jgi:hypothetical protein
MERKAVLFTFTEIVSAFFTNLAAGYFFALPVSTSFLVLLTNMIYCMLCLYIAVIAERFTHYE